MTLKLLQRNFFSSLHDPRGGDADALPILEKGLRKSTRLNIYANAYWIRLEEGLADDFERVAEAVGRQAFSALVRRYMNAHPSQAWTMALVGEKLPGFLAHDPLSREFPFLPDLAALDWALTAIWFAAEPRPFPVESLRDEKTILKRRLALGENTVLLDLKWWKTKRRRTPLLVFRSPRGVKTRRLTRAEFASLSLLKKPLFIVDFLHQIHAGQAAADPSSLQKWIARWVRDGVLNLR